MEPLEVPRKPASDTVRMTVREAQRDLPRLVDRVVVGHVQAVRLTSGQDSKAVLVSDQTWLAMQQLLGEGAPGELA